MDASLQRLMNVLEDFWLGIMGRVDDAAVRIDRAIVEYRLRHEGPRRPTARR
jgi:hypothetical protein